MGYFARPGGRLAYAQYPTSEFASLGQAVGTNGVDSTATTTGVGGSGSSFAARGVSLTTPVSPLNTAISAGGNGSIRIRYS